VIITRERLIELARREAEKRGERRGLLAAYLVGSVAAGDSLLGGTADVDVVMIHREPPLRDREIVSLSADVHLELFHYDRSRFSQPRDLRIDADLGPPLCRSVRLFDPDHFFDWVQAGACAQFDLPDQKLTRARRLLDRARRLRSSLTPGPRAGASLLSAAFDGANAVMMLNDGPCSGRRLIPQLRKRFDQLGRLDLFRAVLALFDADQAASWDIQSWISEWARGYDRLIDRDSDPLRTPVRRDYYLRAFHELADSSEPEAIVPHLVLHWPQPVGAGESDDGKEPGDDAYMDLLAETSLAPDQVTARQHDLETCLDQMELYLEDWAGQHGA
jgi:predicted nucleotidyltransferase